MFLISDWYRDKSLLTLSVDGANGVARLIAPCSPYACLVLVESVNAVRYKLKTFTHPRVTLDRSLSSESQTLKRNQSYTSD
ncbi:MAG: hypothetical protein RMY00_33415 [Nostoc sp. ChiVER01]|nr:hypothetical protein [Nostoc sp. ChiVER01]